MKGRIKKLLLTLLIAMAVVFIGVTPVKSEAARKLPVGGLVQKPMPKNLGVEKMADDDTFAIKTTPRKARFTTGRHYQYLTDEEKFLYEAFYCAALDGNYVPYAKHDKTEEYENYAVVIHTGKESYLEKFQNDAAISYALMKAQFAAACDHPDRVELDMVGLYGFGGKVDNGTYTTYMILVAEADDSKFEQYDAAIKQNVETIVNEIKTNRGATSPWDAVNEKIAYDYYCGEYNLEYDEANMEKSFDYCHTAYGSLVLHKAVCDGYSKGFALIMEKLGIPTMVNDGIAYFTNGGGGGHAWNMVQLDGNWYELDTTWDDGEGDTVTHDFFNKTSSEYRTGENTDASKSKHVRTFEMNYAAIRYPAATGTHWTEPYITAGNYARDTEINLNSISFQNSVYFFEPNMECKLDVILAPENATNKLYRLESSDSSVVAILNNNVYAQEPGVATITAYGILDDSVTGKCTIIVSKNKIAVTGISVDKEITIGYGEETELGVTITPEDAENKEYAIESSDEEVVAVVGDKIKGLKKGSATLTLKTLDGAFTAETNVTVDILPGTAFEVNGYKYRVTGTDTAELTGSKNANLNIPKSFEAAGATFKVTAIADKAFYKNKKILTVKGGKNLKLVGRDAFFKCTKLKSADLSATGITEFGYQAFFGCKKLATLKINGNTLQSSEKDIITGIKKKAKFQVCTKTKKKYKSIVKLLQETGVGKVTFKRVKK